MAKPVVLFISHDASLTGAPLLLGELLSSLVKTELKFEPMVFVRGGGPLLKEWQSAGVHLKIFETFKWKSVIGKSINRLLSLLAYIFLLIRVRPQVVYSNTILNNAEVIIGKLSGARTVVHVHEGKEMMARHLVMMWVSSWFTSRYICVSHYSARALSELVRAHGTVIHNGTGLIRHSLTSDSCARDPMRVLGMVGGIQPNKGHHIAMEAIARLTTEWKHDVYLRIFGDVENWNYRQQLDVLIARLGIGNRVEFCGSVSNQNLIYNNIDGLIVASFDESFGRVILEAFAYAKPVVASAVGGVPEIIRDGENGLLVQADNPAQLADALHRLLGDPSLAKRIARNAEADVRQRFRLEDTLRRLETEIESMLPQL